MWTRQQLYSISTETPLLKQNDHSPTVRLTHLWRVMQYVLSRSSRHFLRIAAHDQFYSSLLCTDIKIQKYLYNRIYLI